MTFTSRRVAQPVLGIFGGGQLARMTCVAAQALGHAVRVLDPDPDCPAATVSDELITAEFDDVIAAQRLALGCTAVTVDLENVGLAALRAAAQHAPMRPSPDVLEVVQNRARQRAWLVDHEIAIPDVFHVSDAGDLDAALQKAGRPAFVKAVQGGYDGKGQVRVRSDADVEEARRLVSATPVVVEAEVDFVAEISVQVARTPDGHMSTFPPALNHHRSQVLEWSMLPAPIDADIALAARTLGEDIAEKLDVVGLLTVELFLTRDGRLLVNELAPRPHNSFHTTLGQARTSQFSQLCRAVLGLPLGEPSVSPTIVMANLLGEHWSEAGTLDVATLLAVPGVDVTVYGKRLARPGRKMGHLIAALPNPTDAFDAASRAMALLGTTLTPSPLLDP